MSYILDALKKNQAEQAGEAVSLRVQTDHTSSTYKNVLLYVLISVVLANIGLLGWIFKDELRQVTSQQASEVPSSHTAPAPTATEPTTTESKTTEPTAPAVARTPKPAATTESAASVAAPTTVQPTSPPSATPPSPSTPSTTAAQQRARSTTKTPIPLAELPPGEQIIYREFNYSSHIYTDDPSLCAIVIDGQRLKAGDAFKGLRVHAVTEAGVIFDETRRGVSRLIEVSIFELWES